MPTAARLDLEQVLVLAAESLRDDPDDVQADSAADAFTAALKFRGITTTYRDESWTVESRLGMVEVSLVPAYVPHDGELPFCDEFAPPFILAAARLLADGAVRLWVEE